MSEARMVVRTQEVEGVVLSFLADDDEPLLAQEDLAMLTQDSVPDLRKAARRLTIRGFLNKNEVLETFPETSPGGGRPAGRMFFTEVQALVILSQSRSTLAGPLTRRMAEVYRAYRKGLLVPAGEPRTGALPQRVEERISALERAVVMLMGQGAPRPRGRPAKVEIGSWPPFVGGSAVPSFDVSAVLGPVNTREDAALAYCRAINPGTRWMGAALYNGYLAWVRGEALSGTAFGIIATQSRLFTKEHGAAGNYYIRI